MLKVRPPTSILTIFCISILSPDSAFSALATPRDLLVYAHAPRRCRGEKGSHRFGPLGPSNRLATELELLDEHLVVLDVLVLQVIQQSATLADHLQEPTSRMVIVLVDLEVFGQTPDSL